MNKYLIVLCFLGLMAGCKGKKNTNLTGEAPVTIEDFINFFPEVSLPFQVTDSSLRKRKSDSTIIAYKVFTQFIPDSVLAKDFGKLAKPKIYPLGRTQEKGKETYLFLKAEQGIKKAGYLVCFNRSDEFLNALTIIRSGFDTYTSAYGSLDKKFQINTYRERKKKDGKTAFKRNVFIYNSASNEFTLILTEPNEEFVENIINPIDTLPKKNKYSGDYPKDKKNFISFRDGRTPSQILFFAHFEKDAGQCVGELKGAAHFTSPKTASFKENGSPCTVEFTFGVSSVTMKEIEGCGSFRDIKCFFDGVYPKKKEIKAKTAKKK